MSTTFPEEQIHHLVLRLNDIQDNLLNIDSQLQTNPNPEKVQELSNPYILNNQEYIYEIKTIYKTPIIQMKISQIEDILESINSKKQKIKNSPNPTKPDSLKLIKEEIENIIAKSQNLKIQFEKEFPAIKKEVYNIKSDVPFIDYREIYVLYIQEFHNYLVIHLNNPQLKLNINMALRAVDKLADILFTIDEESDKFHEKSKNINAEYETINLELKPIDNQFIIESAKELDFILNELKKINAEFFCAFYDIKQLKSLEKLLDLRELYGFYASNYKIKLDKFDQPAYNFPILNLKIDQGLENLKLLDNKILEIEQEYYNYIEDKPDNSKALICVPQEEKPITSTRILEQKLALLSKK